MKASIGLEFIGCNSADLVQSLARIEGCKPDKPLFGPFVRVACRNDDGEIVWRTIYGQRDYSKANSKGSRGVYVWYTLEEDKLYFVKEPKSWKSSAYYYCAVSATGDVIKVSEEDAREWLSAL